MTASTRSILFLAGAACAGIALAAECSGEACQDAPQPGADVSGLLQTNVKVKGLMPEAADHSADKKSEANTKAALDVISGATKVAVNAEGSPGETVRTFCDAHGVARMHGAVGGNGTVVNGEQEALMANIMDDVAKELTENSIDQMVKDIFSFYICVRWVPDEVFWKVAEQELAAEILQSVVATSESATQVIAELYQNFKFVPLLCSKNLKVYDETSDVDHTYFTVFKEKVSTISTALATASSGAVWTRLKQADEIFCGGAHMNSATCDAANSAANWANANTAWMGRWGTNFDTQADKWVAMENIFQQFKYHPTDAEWNTDFTRWKNLFPYHSFLAKPAGADPAHSPSSTQRFLVCFGKRVASELHRRPRGDHIITDQNNVGCHGWWDSTHVSDMLSRTVKLWKPPTCDIAEMSYHMKKAILKQFMKMNEQLFEALPSMLSDEELEANGELDEALAGPRPYDVASLTVSGATYFDGTRVASTADITYESTVGRRRRCYNPFHTCGDNTVIQRGHAGTIVTDGQGTELPVKWDGSDTTLRTTNPDHIKVVPHEYGMPVAGILDTIAGWTTTGYQSISGFMGSMWGGQYTSLAGMMSGSVAKWVVCPLAADINLTDLDNNLGTEDVVFREFVKEAYSKWTGYEAALPGAECAVENDFADSAEFPGCQVCEFSELHVSFPEKYFKGPGDAEDFMCPVVPAMDPAEQLQVFKEKSGMCLLHMTNNQNRQHQWNYQGHHPARTQNNPQNNTPQTEFELVKLLDISESPGLKQIAYGRTCTVEEQKANPRFCGANEFFNPWSTIEEMSAAVSSWLQGSLGMPVGAITSLIGDAQELIQANSTSDRAALISEKAWNSLMGLGRLAHSSATAAASEVAYSLDGSDKRHARLESELFAASHGGDFVHGMSYQKEIGSNGRSSNARQRYRRYAVVCPCRDFDPAMELAQRWQWSEVVLRAFREGMRGNPALLDAPSATVQVRSEARLFFRDNTNEAENNTWYSYGASIHAGELAVPAPAPPVSCTRTGSWYSGYSCSPGESCSGRRRRMDSCEPNPTPAPGAAPNPWKVVWDGKLARELGGAPIGDTDLGSLKALTMTLYCGKKKDFNAAGGPTVHPSSLKRCMQDGVRQNAAMKSEKPWKLYFPDEVIVVATFGTIETSKCHSTAAATENLICSGATKAHLVDAHLGPDEKTASGGTYHGMRTGSGYPKGTLKEVVLRPEDVLEVNGLLI